MGPSKNKVLLVRAKAALSKATTVIFVCKRAIDAELLKMARQQKEEERLQKGQEKRRLIQKVLRMRKAGLTCKNIASELNLHPTTVSKMCSFAKRQATTKPELPRKRGHAAAGR